MPESINKPEKIQYYAVKNIEKKTLDLFNQHGKIIHCFSGIEEISCFNFNSQIKQNSKKLFCFMFATKDGGIQFYHLNKNTVNKIHEEQLPFNYAHSLSWSDRDDELNIFLPKHLKYQMTGFYNENREIVIQQYRDGLIEFDRCWIKIFQDDNYSRLSHSIRYVFKNPKDTLFKSFEIKEPILKYTDMDGDNFYYDLRDETKPKNRRERPTLTAPLVNYTDDDFENSVVPGENKLNQFN